MQKYLRGQVWFYSDPKNEMPKTNCENSVQRGSRPVIIVSNNTGNKKSPVLTVVPCTTQQKSDIPTHFSFFLDAVPNTVLCEQIFTVGKADLTTYRGTLDDTEVSMLNKCLSVALLLNEPQIIVQAPTQQKVLSDIASTKVTNSDNFIQPIKKRVYTKRTDEEKLEIINAYCAVSTPAELDELVRRYGFTNSKMLIQSVERWMNK